MQPGALLIMVARWGVPEARSGAVPYVLLWVQGSQMECAKLHVASFWGKKKIIYFPWKSKLERKKIFSSLVHSPKWPLMNLSEIGSLEPLHFVHESWGPSTRAVLCHFIRPLPGSWISSGAARTPEGALMGCQHSRLLPAFSFVSLIWVIAAFFSKKLLFLPWSFYSSFWNIIS